MLTKKLVALSTNCIKSLAAAIVISIAGYCYLLNEDRWLGAILFSFGLIYVCKYKMNLFTGMAGYITTTKVPSFAISTIVNLITAFIIGKALSYNPDAVDRASSLLSTKIGSSTLSILISSVMCGVLIFLSVDYYKRFSSIIGIIFAIPIFVLCGFDHAVADAFYIGIVGGINKTGVLFLLTVVVGNIIGSTLMRVLLFLFKENLSENNNV